MLSTTLTTKFSPLHSAKTLPSKKALQSVAPEVAETAPADSVSFSAAAHQQTPGTSALKKIGFGAAAVLALGGAFLAGSYFTSQPEPTLGSQFESFGRDLNRGAEDFQRELGRAKEDFKTEYHRSKQDAQRPPTEGEQFRRDVEDKAKEIRRNTEDFTRQQGRKIGDWWKSVTRD